MRAGTPCETGPLTFRCTPCIKKRRTCSWKQDFIVNCTVKHFKFSTHHAEKLYQDCGRSLKASEAAARSKATGIDNHVEQEEGDPNKILEGQTSNEPVIPLPDCGLQSSTNQTSATDAATSTDHSSTGEPQHVLRTNTGFTTITRSKRHREELERDGPSKFQQIHDQHQSPSKAQITQRPLPSKMKLNTVRIPGGASNRNLPSVQNDNFASPGNAHEIVSSSQSDIPVLPGHGVKDKLSSPPPTIQTQSAPPPSSASSTLYSTSLGASLVTSFSVHNPMVGDDDLSMQSQPSSSVQLMQPSSTSKHDPPQAISCSIEFTTSTPSDPSTPLRAMSAPLPPASLLSILSFAPLDLVVKTLSASFLAREKLKERTFVLPPDAIGKHEGILIIHKQLKFTEEHFYHVINALTDGVGRIKYMSKCNTGIQQQVAYATMAATFIYDIRL